jgi:hypothetical protein
MILFLAKANLTYLDFIPRSEGRGYLN